MKDFDHLSSIYDEAIALDGIDVAVPSQSFLRFKTTVSEETIDDPNDTCNKKDLLSLQVCRSWGFWPRQFFLVCRIGHAVLLHIQKRAYDRWRDRLLSSRYNTVQFFLCSP